MRKKKGERKRGAKGIRRCKKSRPKKAEVVFQKRPRGRQSKNGNLEKYRERVRIFLTDPDNKRFDVRSRAFKKYLGELTLLKSGEGLKGRVLLSGLSMALLQKVTSSFGLALDPTIPVTIRTRHIFSILSNGDAPLKGKDKHPHELTPSQFVSAMRSIGDPLFITQSKQGNLSVFTEVKDKYGNNILCVFDFRSPAYGYYLLTVFGKNLTLHFFENNELRYISEEMKRALAPAHPHDAGFSNALYAYMLQHKGATVKKPPMPL